MSDFIDGSVDFSKTNLVRVLSANTKNFEKPELIGLFSSRGLNSVYS